MFVACDNNVAFGLLSKLNNVLWYVLQTFYNFHGAIRQVTTLKLVEPVKHEGVCSSSPQKPTTS